MVKDQAFPSLAFLVFFVLLVSWTLRFCTVALPVFVAVDGGTGLAAGKFDIMKLESGRRTGSTLLAAACEA
jgi:hypothetical protein